MWIDQRHVFVVRLFFRFSIYVLIVASLYWLGRTSLWLIPFLGYFIYWVLRTALFLVRAKFPRSVPYRILIKPDIGKMLSLLTIMSEEEWKHVMERPANPDPTSGDYLARNGVYAITLESKVNGPVLVHWPQLQDYSSSLACGIPLEFLKSDDPTTNLPKAGFFMRRGEHGYLLGISVDFPWWQKHQSYILHSGIMKGLTGKFGETLHIGLQVLPYPVLWKYEPVWWANCLKAINRTLPAFGWTNNREAIDGIYESPLAYVRVEDLARVKQV